MSMLPTSIKWRLSPDAYGRVTEVVFERLYDGKSGYKIIVHAANQRDETQTINLLTDQQLADIAVIAERHKPRKA